MSSNVDICNLALIRIGEAAVANIETPFNNERERKLAAIYSYWRDMEQASYPWPFCRKRLELALLPETPAYGWSYMYQLPADYLAHPSSSTNYTFQIEGDKVLSNEASFIIGYTARITDPTKFSFEFIELLVSRLALELSYNLSDSATLTASMFDMYKKAETKARNLASVSRGTNPIAENLKYDMDWINAGRY